MFAAFSQEETKSLGHFYYVLYPYFEELFFLYWRRTDNGTDSCTVLVKWKREWCTSNCWHTGTSYRVIRSWWHMRSLIVTFRSFQGNASLTMPSLHPPLFGVCYFSCSSPLNKLRRSTWIVLSLSFFHSISNSLLRYAWARTGNWFQDVGNWWGQIRLYCLSYLPKICRYIPNIQQWVVEHPLSSFLISSCYPQLSVTDLWAWAGTHDSRFPFIFGTCSRCCWQRSVVLLARLNFMGSKPASRRCLSMVMKLWPEWTWKLLW